MSLLKIDTNWFEKDVNNHNKCNKRMRCVNILNIDLKRNLSNSFIHQI